MRNVYIGILIILSIICIQSINAAIKPNSLLSRGKLVYSSSGNAAILTDNKFGGSSWTVSNNSWVAINIGSGSSKIFLTWNNPAYPWSNELAPSNCPNNISFPVDYNILVSTNSTNGANGSWTLMDSVRTNIVSARGHYIDFNGFAWIKILIIKGGGTIDEIEVFDVSNGKEDTWFFAGTSISANTYKGTPPASNFADLVNIVHAGHNPSMIRGGIGCISSSDLVKNLSKYLKMAGNVHYWAIEMGTNDAWGGTNGNVVTFKNNLQKVIDSCKVWNIEPIIARVLATNKTAAGWQINADFQKAVDDLTAKNKLIPGPDLYTWFLNHPGDLNSDGIHPNAAGAASIQKLWTEKMDSLYSSPTTVFIDVNPFEIKIYPNPTKGFIEIDTPFISKMFVFNTLGNLQFAKQLIKGQNIIDETLSAGIYFINITSAFQENKTFKLIVN